MDFSQSQSVDVAWRQDVALKLFDHVESQVRLADQKAGAIFTANSVLFALYAAIINSTLPLNLQVGQKFLILGSAGIASLAIVASLLFVLLSINPVSRIEPYDQYQIFFKLIASPTHNLNAQDYQKKFLELSREEITGQLLRSIHGKSEWANKKLSAINNSVWLSFASVAFAAIAGLSSFAARF